MNPIFTESIFFLKSNFKLITLFVLPFALLSIGSDVIGVFNPRSSTYDFLVFAYSIFITPIYTGVILILIDKLANKQKISFIQIISKSLSLWVPLFLVSLFYGLIILGGLILLVIPGIWLFVRLILSPLYVVFNGKTASEAIAFAFNESKPHFSQFLFALLPIIIIILISAFITFSFPITSNYFSTIVKGIFSEYLFVLTAVIQYRLYLLFVNNA